MPYVLDASIAVALVFPDEDTDDSVRRTLPEDSPLVPAVWPFEVANALLAARSSGRLSQDEVPRVARELSALEAEVQPASVGRALNDVLNVAVRYGLTIYDATYVELAIRRALPIATLDRQVRTASLQSGLNVLPR